MSPQICLLLLAATSFGFTSSSVFGPTSHWLRKPNSDETDKTLKFATILRLRGGEEAKQEGTDKIKGCCIGIDLGTTYRYECCRNDVTSSTLHHPLISDLPLPSCSCVAVWKNGRVEICPNEQGNRITPSYVGWSSDGQRLVGDAAKNQAASNPINTVFDVKRLIGRKFSDASIQRDSKLFPFKSKSHH
jgi:Hsp70 protein